MGCGTSRDMDAEPVRLDSGFKLPDYEKLRAVDMEEKQALDLMREKSRVEAEVKAMGLKATPRLEDGPLPARVEYADSEDDDSWISSEGEEVLEEEVDLDGVVVDETLTLEAGPAFTVDELEVASGLLAKRSAFERKLTSKASFHAYEKTAPAAQLLAIQGRFEQKEVVEEITPEKEEMITEEPTKELQEKVDAWKKARRKTKRKVKKEDMHITRAPLQTEKIQSKYAPTYASIAPEYQTIQELKV